MARGDKSGPMGQGPMTGRGLGYCAGYDSPGYTKGFGGGMGRGRGFGGGIGRGGGMGRGRFFGNMGWGNYPNQGINPTYSRDDEIRNLKAQAESLKQTQNDIERRLKELGKEE
ncbi:MAG: DUF5320 domain-containing protein [Prolixibacteraceae bacterium]|nr:DUF5320 domain-containing protein [Prolixibacteraceae bacterium]